MSKFSATGRVARETSNLLPVNVQQQQQAFYGKPDQAGVVMTAEEMATHSTGNRVGLYVVGIAVLAALAIGIAAIIVTTRGGGGGGGVSEAADIGRDSLSNDYEAAVIEYFTIEDNEFVDVECSGVFIGPSGQIMTAVHCLQNDPDFCDFDTATAQYDLLDRTDDETFWADVMGINGGTEKRTFQLDVIGWSGVTDVAVLQARPLAVAGGFPLVASFINITNQPFFTFDDSRELHRGQTIETLSFDLGFLKKLAHRGAVQAQGLDRGASFVVSVDQVFFNGNAMEGASGSGVWNREGELVLAPLTYLWDWDGVYSNSGTSSHVSRRVVGTILDAAFVPDGTDNKLLVPSLGAITFESNNGPNLIDFDTASFLAAQLPNYGIFSPWLADQNWFDFLNEVVEDTCLDPTYNVTVPSMLGATLVETIYGTPLDTYPAGITFDLDAYVWIIEMEKHLGRGDWVQMGDDAGSTSPSAVIIGGGKKAGDVVRVKVRALNVNSPTDPTVNWIGVYAVTLQKIDPVWDSIGAGNDFFGNYASHIHLDEASMHMYLSPGVRMPKKIARRNPTGAAARAKQRRAAKSAHRFVLATDPAPAASARTINVTAITDLPTLTDAYKAYMQTLGQKRKGAPKPRRQAVMQRAREIAAARRAAAKKKKPTTKKTSRSNVVVPRRHPRPVAQLSHVSAAIALRERQKAERARKVGHPVKKGRKPLPAKKHKSVKRQRK
jgi:hypothetical protein